jgi:hypothetical protein
MTDIIEIMARKMWDAREQCLPERTRMTWEAGTDAAKSTCWLMADAAVRAIADAGLAIVPDWQPVETAPDDGSEFWTYSPLPDGSGSYDTAEWVPDLHDFCKRGCGWQYVTHWKPLDAPKSVQSGKDVG